VCVVGCEFVVGDHQLYMGSSGYQKVRYVFFVGGHQSYMGYCRIVAVKATVPHIFINVKVIQ
jgi:hypothetical protein